MQGGNGATIQVSKTNRLEPLGIKRGSRQISPDLMMTTMTEISENNIAAIQIATKTRPQL